VSSHLPVFTFCFHIDGGAVPAASSLRRFVLVAFRSNSVGALEIGSLPGNLFFFSLFFVPFRSVSQKFFFFLRLGDLSLFFVDETL